MLSELKPIIKDTIAFLMPCSGDVDPRTLQSATALVSFSCSNGYKVSQFGVTRKTLVHTARNMLADGFLKTDCEWAFWMDSDMILEPRTLPVMMNWAKKTEAEFLTGVYYQRIGAKRPLIMVRHKNKEYRDGYEMNFVLPDKNRTSPFVVDACGFGCVLMKRDILLKLKEPYFMTLPLDSGKELSEDFYFCRNAKEAGIKLWAVPELRCGHIGDQPVIYRENFEREAGDLCKKIEVGL